MELQNTNIQELGWQLSSTAWAATLLQVLQEKHEPNS